MIPRFPPCGCHIGGGWEGGGGRGGGGATRAVAKSHIKPHALCIMCWKVHLSTRAIKMLHRFFPFWCIAQAVGKKPLSEGVAVVVKVMQGLTVHLLSP